MKLDLEQIEADVVILVHNKPYGTFHVFPLWECGMHDKELDAYAANCGLRAVETDGSGHAHVTIHDFRYQHADEVIAELAE